EMNKASVESSFSLTDSDGENVSGAFVWSGASVVFESQNNLKYGIDYAVKIAGSAMSVNNITLDANMNGSSEGSPKDDFVWTFTTETFPSLVVEIKPANKSVIKGNIVVVDLVAKDVSSLGSFSFDVNFDPTILNAINVSQVSFANWRPRPKEIGESDIWLPIVIDNNKGKVTISASKTRDVGVTGTGVLATITFETIGIGESSIDFQNVSLENILGETIAFALLDAKLAVVDFDLFDVNKDGVVDILDFISTRPDDKADVNGDGIVDILDVVALINHEGDIKLWDTNGDGVVDINDFIKIESSNGINPDVNGDGVVDILDIVSILNGAKGAPASRLVNELGVSFPNPINPEAWIPFKLAESNDVVIKLYNTKGQLVRTLDLGYRVPGSYITRTMAAYWDGKDENGQHVSSGIYFYNIKAGSFTATKKLIVLE
ncbi:MAG: type sorting protein, partial [Candidatus Poribacteria bacterium]|nr:type sorting protein [Candidatus Poribacteria bacterium]